VRRPAGAALLALLLQSGCGYVGPVQPPSPMVPLPISDLTAVERGNKIYIAFTAPATTSDALTIKRFSEIELRMGPEPKPFNYAEWEKTSRQYLTPSPAQSDPDEPKPFPIALQVPVSEWQGQSVAIAVRTAVKGQEHFSGWSNRLHLDVVPPLNPPVVKQDATREGYRLTWEPQREGLHYQVFRVGPNDKSPVAVGTAEKGEFVDTTAQWDTPYQYTVVAQFGTSVESFPSAPVAANHRDSFPPTVPADLTALAGPDSIEISWTRSPEPDTKGYRVYRSVGNAEGKPIGDLTPLPTFSDRAVQHGQTYRYVVTSVDNQNNESEKSKPVEVVY
jgi:fibronectin type 3 domain-containing protein